MNSRDDLKKNRNHNSRIIRRIAGQYVLALAGFIIGVLLFTLLAWQFLGMFTWQPNDPLYIILRFIRKYILLFIGLSILAGWAWITYRFMGRPLRYLDDVITASERLADPTEAQIILPDAMKTVQDEMNRVRERALRGARLAKEEEQRKNDMIVYLAHDLKTPLTSVVGYLTLLRDEEQISPELRAKYTGIALSKAERMEDLLNDLFDITRFNLTSMTLNLDCIHLSRMLEQIASEFSPLLSDKELRWATDIQSNVDLEGDANKLERVFDNLIRNAVSYSYAGTEIRLTLHKQDDDAEICICNRGKTIPPEKLNRIFEQFFRLDTSRSTATGGAGLGLAIAKEIVELHGGTITAQSADDSVRFLVRLPLRKKIV